MANLSAHEVQALIRAGVPMAEARILRLGRRQAVCEVSLFCAGQEDVLVAHVTGTYALPG